MSENPLRVVIAGPVSVDDENDVPVINDGVVQEIRFAIGTGAAQSSATTIPNGAIIGERYLDIVTPYSPGTTIEVGNAGTPTALMGVADSVPTSAAVYSNPADDSVWAGPAAVLVTVIGGPVAGAGFCVVQYVQNPQA
jgi:hypothetical protein